MGCSYLLLVAMYTHSHLLAPRVASYMHAYV